AFGIIGDHHQAFAGDTLPAGLTGVVGDNAGFFHILQVSIPKGVISYFTGIKSVATELTDGKNGIGRRSPGLLDGLSFINISDKLLLGFFINERHDALLDLMLLQEIL